MQGYVRRLLAGRKGRKLPAPYRPRPPDALARAYMADLFDMQRYAWGLVLNVVPALQASLRRAAAVRGDGLKLDDAPNDIQRELNGVKIAFQRRYSKAEAQRIAERMAARGQVFAAEEVEKQFRKLIGIDIVSSSPAVELAASAAVVDNVALIESIPSEFFSDIEREVMSTLRTGANTDDLRDLLMERYDVSKSRATLIAVDQTNKLNGNLTQTLQTQNGVTRYIWRSSQDERVRDTHRLLDGKTFSWDDPPEVGHPGQDYRCRCQAEADIEGMLEGLESEED